MKIVLDSNILVRSFSRPGGLAHQILLLLTRRHDLILSNELVSEVTKVLRYPRMMSLHGRDEEAVYDFASSLREIAQFVVLDPLHIVRTRDRDDVLVLQTAIAGDANILCTLDRDFFHPPASGFLASCGVSVLTDVELMRILHG